MDTPSEQHSDDIQWVPEAKEVNPAELPAVGESQTLPAIPDGFQLVDIQKLRDLLQITKAIKMQNVEYSEDVNALINAFVDVMEATGLNELIISGQKPSAMTLTSKMLKLVPGLMKGTNTQFMDAGKTISDFLKKYGQETESIKMLTDGNNTE